MTTFVYLYLKIFTFLLFYNCVYFFMYLFLYFLNSLLVFLEDHIENKCAIVYFNVFILGKYYIYIYIYMLISLFAFASNVFIFLFACI